MQIPAPSSQSQMPLLIEGSRLRLLLLQMECVDVISLSLVIFTPWISFLLAMKICFRGRDTDKAVTEEWPLAILASLRVAIVSTEEAS